jgi:Mg2+/Co2+ transporter CorB
MCCLLRVNKCDILWNSELVSLVMTLDSLPEGLGLVTGQIFVGCFFSQTETFTFAKDKTTVACEAYLTPPTLVVLESILKSRSPLPTSLLMTNVLKVTQSAICSGYSHPCEWILYPCLGGQETESCSDWIWLLLKVASELMFRATIISIDNSVECILNTVLFITLVLVCPCYLFTLLSFPTPSFMTVFSIETDKVCSTQSSH